MRVCIAYARGTHSARWIRERFADAVDRELPGTRRARNLTKKMANFSAQDILLRSNSSNTEFILRIYTRDATKGTCRSSAHVVDRILILCKICVISARACYLVFL